MTKSARAKYRAKLKRTLREGINKWLVGDYPGALSHFLSVRRFFGQSELSYLRQYFIDTGLVYRALGQNELAIKYYERALEVEAKEEFERHDIASLKANLAYALMCLNRLNEAHKYLEEAEQYFKSIYDHANRGEVLETRARVYLAQGDPVKAEETAQQAYDLLRKYSDRKAAKQAHETLGMCMKANADCVLGS